MSLASASGRLTAVLGPTNTGKTYLAIERMLGHESGMIGFPLRLLARENYDRMVRLKGAGQVALITGEEKIVPASARYFVCTVESMPVDRPVSFLAVDEVQMAADPERGHFFTDRILHARGMNETMLLGADTIRPVLNRLLPDIDVIARPRFSKLSYVGSKKATRLPRRSAVVGFSANEIYSIAELIRRQRGGTAIVMGALSPRTRNAQVEMFQSGEVEYLVATDAIGMGLNMDVNHVWFASLRKYDGRQMRPLRNVELAQIAGRAGRHMNDGTFGTTIDVGGLDAGAGEGGLEGGGVERRPVPGGAVVLHVHRLGEARVEQVHVVDIHGERAGAVHDREGEFLESPLVGGGAEDAVAGERDDGHGDSGPTVGGVGGRNLGKRPRERNVLDRVATHP